MVQEEFRKETKIPTPCSLPPPVNLKEGYIVVSVYLVAWWVEEVAL
jgi:hypothetical protein